MADTYERRIVVTRIIDADTLVADVDLGMRQWFCGVQLRLLRINAPEVHGPSAPAEHAATAYTDDWLHIHNGHGRMYGRTELTDSFGRYLAEVTCGGCGHNLSDDLLTSGNAVLYKAK
jgi:endonuclease YncB( thermonuclease family)